MTGGRSSDGPAPLFFAAHPRAAVLPAIGGGPGGDFGPALLLGAQVQRCRGTRGPPGRWVPRQRWQSPVRPSRRSGRMLTRPTRSSRSSSRGRAAPRPGGRSGDGPAPLVCGAHPSAAVVPAIGMARGTLGGPSSPRPFPQRHPSPSARRGGPGAGLAPGTCLPRGLWTLPGHGPPGRWLPRLRGQSPGQPATGPDADPPVERSAQRPASAGWPQAGRRGPAGG